MGIDIGSRTSKGVIIRDGSLSASHTLASGINYLEIAQKLRNELLAKAKLKTGDISRTITTGHGSGVISFSDQHISDMQCCTRGMHSIFPQVRTVIDVQGQSSQVLQLDEQGQVVNFIVSEACASGSGYFLEVIANVLQVKLEDIGPLSLESKKPVTFTTSCAVFGESEAISRVAEGIRKEDILAGVHSSLANRISTLINRLGAEEPYAISGGGGLDAGLVIKIEELGFPLLVPPQPQLINALGAALIAGE